ncbi:MAG: FHA domain-containing protein, partial [Anaerolineales bacterium]
MTDSRTPTGPSPLEFPERPVDVSQDRIQVLEPHQTARAVPMQPRGLAIGRAPDNDIVLDYPEVSEHHARIEFDGTHYLVLDLNSTNGTYLADARLPAGVPVIWPAATGLRIGEVWLHALRANAEAAEPADTEAQAPPQIKGSAIDPDLVHFSPAKRIGLFTELSQLSIAPGKSVTLSIVVLNLGATADHVTLSVTGIPANWLAAPAPTLHLLPNTQQEVKLTLHPPGSPQSHAGRYPVTIQVASHSAPSEVAETKLTLTVLAFSAFTSDLRPQSIPANEMAQVTIQNQGNTQETFALTWEDPANELAFDLPPNQIPIAEGQTAVAEFRAAPRVRRIIGGEQAYPFTVLVSSPSGETQTHTGEVVSSAMIPAWLPPLLLVMCLLLGAAAALIYSDYNSRLASATQAALANQTAVVLAADPDGDRLSNADESRLGTDPLKPDSDGDGLPDGDEITWGTNPLVADTDGDTIPDGREVLELRTSP